MKSLFKYFMTLCVFLLIGLPNLTYAQYVGTGSNKKTTKVKGYYKKDGTYVSPHRRTKTNEYNLDNFKAKGNYNPYTGKTGNKKYKSPYNSFKKYKSSSNFKLYKTSKRNKSSFKTTKQFKFKKLKKLKY